MLTRSCVSNKQLRVTAARPGTVNFELEIRKEHTVRQKPFLPLPSLPFLSYIFGLALIYYHFLKLSC